jgi:hypothetical protein
MPLKKLTLSVDEDVIRKAKRYSQRHETSLSKLVTDFLSRLVDTEGTRTPVVSRLRGILPRGIDVDEHRKYLEQKHR